MKTHILVNNKKEIFERNQPILIELSSNKLKGKYTYKWLDVFQACEYDEQRNILGVNYVAYAIAKTRQWLNCPALPYIEAFTDAENLKIQQELQKRLCVSEMKRLIKSNQEIRFHNTEYGIEGAGKSLKEAIETFIDNAVKSFIKDGIDPQGIKKEYREISFYNVEDCEVYLPKKYIDKIWDEIEYRFGEEIKSVYNFSIDEATRAEKIWEMDEGR